MKKKSVKAKVIAKARAKAKTKKLKARKIKDKKASYKYQKFIARRKEIEHKEEMEILLQIYQVINSYFKDFMSNLDNINDIRDEKADYTIKELVFACIAMFIFKQGSRHNFNQLRKKKGFRCNFKLVFNLRLPHMDTVDRVLRELDNSELQNYKINLVKEMISKKAFANHRLFGKFYTIAIDGSGVHNYDEQHCPKCSHNTSSKGDFQVDAEALAKLKDEGIPENIIQLLRNIEGIKVRGITKFTELTTETLKDNYLEEYEPYIRKHCGNTNWFHNVLEAKLVSSNGFSISIETEWIENDDYGYVKQDCELNAFKRITKRIKDIFPQLPICVVIDGLYANQSLFDCCTKMGWEYVVTFKKGNLRSVWKKINSFDKSNNKTCKSDNVLENYSWFNNVKYNDETVNWIKCCEKKPPSSKNKSGITNFVYLTSFEITEDNCHLIVGAGRLRQKIENEGFNTQKNHGYNMCHKFSRVSNLACKNYYQSLQIAHIIVSIVELSSKTRVLRKTTTLKSLWGCLIGFLIYYELSHEDFNSVSNKRTHFQFS